MLVNEVMAGFLPQQDNTAGTFCLFVGCDQRYQTLCDETRGLPNKRTFGGGDPQATSTNANGIPPYYYQKPEETRANGGRNEANKRVKKDNS